MRLSCSWVHGKKYETNTQMFHEQIGKCHDMLEHFHDMEANVGKKVATLTERASAHTTLCCVRPAHRLVYAARRSDMPGVDWLSAREASVYVIHPHIRPKGLWVVRIS